MVEIKTPLEPKTLYDKISKKMSELYLGKPVSIWIEGREIFSEAVVLQNIQPYSMDFTTFLGKASGTLYSLVFKYGKFFKVFKIKESLYVSPVYSPYYQLTIKQKEEIENSIKVQLAQIASAISDTELIAHDYRKYKQFFEIIKKIEELEEKLKKMRNEKIKDEIKKEESLLRSTFIDQVDIHTGDFSIINLARTRWPTLISDFMQLENEETAEEILRKIKNITTAEAILLAKKNKLYLEWKKMFFEAVKERFERIKNLLEMRKFSIESYKEMVRPLIKKWLTYQESLPSKTAPWSKPASMAQVVESTTFWMIKPIPFSQYEAEETYESKLRNLRELGIKDENILENLGVKKEEVEKILSRRLPVEPSIDRISLIGLLVLNEHFDLNFDLKDLIEIRNFLISKTSAQVGEEIWKLSPYYAFFEISLDRTIFKMPDGTELEDVTLTISPYLISQNIAMLIFLQEKMLDKHIDNIANKFLGEKEISIKTEEKKELKNYVIENCKWFKEKYLKFSEFTFIKKFFGIPKILYNKAYADEYFYGYVVEINEDLKRTLFSMFNFPV